MKKEYLTPKAVAALLMVSTVTVRLWAQKGELKSHLTPGGHRRFLRRDLMRFARSRGIELSFPGEAAIKILVVDDDLAFGEMVVRTLHESVDDIETDVADCGYSAVQKVHAFDPDVVLLDLKMPEIDVLSVCNTIKNNHDTKSVRVIALTSDYTPESVARVKKVGAESCLAKPLNRKKLLNAIGVGTDVAD